MPQGKSMEVSQLRAVCNDFAAGKSYSAIKEARKLAKSTLQNIKSRLLANGLLDPVKLSSTSDEQLVRVMYGNKAQLEVTGRKGAHRIVVGKSSFSRIDASNLQSADFPSLVLRFSTHRNITKEDLYRDYVSGAIEAGKDYYRRTTFMRLLNDCIDSNKDQEIYLRRTHIYGDELQIDWCGEHYPILIQTDHPSIANYGVFVMTWPASYYVYAQFVPDQTTKTTCEAIRNGLMYFGCKPLRLVIDNARQMVTKHKPGHEAIFNEAFQYCMEQYGIEVDANNPHSPNEKSACERNVGLIQSRVLTRMQPGELRTIDQANRELMEKVNKYINNERFRGGGIHETRSCLFLEHEKPAAIPIVSPLPEPAEHFPFLTVGLNYCVKVKGAMYSVPYTLAGKMVDAEISGGAVIIYHNHKEVARHPCLAEGGSEILPEHMPENHRHQVTKEAKYGTREKLMAAALAQSKQLYAYCDLMLSKGSFPEMKKACIAVINKYVGNKYPKEIMDAAIDCAFHDCKPEKINSYLIDQYIKDLVHETAANGGRLPEQKDLFDDLPHSHDGSFIRGNDDLLGDLNLGAKKAEGGKDHE